MKRAGRMEEAQGRDGRDNRDWFALLRQWDRRGCGRAGENQTEVSHAATTVIERGLPGRSGVVGLVRCRMFVSALGDDGWVG